MRYREPFCVALDGDDRPCGVRMRTLGERDPSFGPGWKPGMHVFRCPRCGAVQAFSQTDVGKYLERA